MSRQYCVIYVKKESCPACMEFESTWLKIRQNPNLKNKITFSILAIPNGGGISSIPPCLRRYVQWFPTILLMDKQEYDRYFLQPDVCRMDDYLNVKKFSATDGRPEENLFVPLSESNIIDWLNRKISSQ